MQTWKLIGTWCALAVVPLSSLAVKGKSAAAAKRSIRPSSIQQTMLLLVDPAADALWDSVGTSQTASGTKVKQPSTPAAWAKVAAQAQSIVDGARLLQQTGFPVGQNAHSKLADADTPGTRTAVQIRADIDSDPARFRAAAARLEVAANSALVASKTHDAAGVLNAGAELDAACEACHAAYWYPRMRPLRLPSPEEFAAKKVR